MPSPTPAYPAPLARAEDQAIAQRRAAQSVPPPAAPAIGLALSGGGIRSATFCIGVAQTLARNQLLRRVDFLSTVSGGGYFGSFLGALCSREGGSIEKAEASLAENHSQAVGWLRENGRFLSPNGADDNWVAASVALRNWSALQVVLLTFAFFLLGTAAIARALLVEWVPHWKNVETWFFDHPALYLWWSPWVAFTLVPLILIMLPAGTLYWTTQSLTLMRVVRDFLGLCKPCLREISELDCANRIQNLLTQIFGFGLIATVTIFICATIDSIGQTAYWVWSSQGFSFPSLWASLTTAGAAAYGMGGKLSPLIEKISGRRKIQVPVNVVALGLAFTWLLLISTGISVFSCWLAWDQELVWNGSELRHIQANAPLLTAVAAAFLFSCWFSRSFSFVNLSSLQQVYAARLRRAYIGASNPLRQQSANHSMTALIPGDDLSLEDYQPHVHGGPLHLINVTVNETISGKTQIQRKDRKGLNLAIGPCGLSTGIRSHALWSERPAHESRPPMLNALFETPTRPIAPIPHAEPLRYHALHANRPDRPIPPQRVESLPLGRWIAISGAAFTTGLGSGTKLGLSLLLGLGNIRLGYWWDSGIPPWHRAKPPGYKRPSIFIKSRRLFQRVLPVQTCLVNEFFARFHGSSAQHWYLSDGGHFENTACYELIRRRVPFIVCTDSGQDTAYQFSDLAGLIRKARNDFDAELQILRRRVHMTKDDPDSENPLPVLEDILHPDLLDVIGSPEDFSPLSEDAPPTPAKAHALLARITYNTTSEVSWLLVIKPSLMTDEALDVTEYQRAHPLFPQEPTSDQYFDEAQWESYRKLGEHIGAELFTTPKGEGIGWSPSQFRAPDPAAIAQARAAVA